MAGDEVKPVDASDGDTAAARGEDLQPARLPEDVLAEVLRRVPPRWLAASRCVCRAWRDAIDARGLLRADLLPLSLAGLFVHFDEHKYPEFLARPSSTTGVRALSGNLSFLPSTTPHAGTIWDNCDDWYDYNIDCRADLIMRISLSDNTYSVIKPPVMDTRAHHYPCVEIVRSKKGVYFVAFDRYWPQHTCWLGVWILNESCAQMEWMLKHDKGLKHALAHHRYHGRLHWILEDINYNLFRSSSFPEYIKKATTEENFEWNSDDDVENEDMVNRCCLENNKKSIVEKKLDWKSDNHNALNDDDMVEECYWDEEHYDDSYDEDIEILGFHPYKEIVVLSASEQTALAYNLNGSKIEELGNIYPKDYVYFKELSNQRERIKSFPYTPCWMEEFPGNN